MAINPLIKIEALENITPLTNCRVVFNLIGFGALLLLYVDKILTYARILN